MLAKDYDSLKCFVYHSDLAEAVVKQMSDIRQMYINLGSVIVETVPNSRSRGLALAYLEDSLMRAIQALALSGKPVVDLFD